ncbi:MAG: hypothetical protein JKY54_10830 [Flavobacteriales bacterium]|nr:hypothetical protein [Flavobacteriales bacterium]
MRNLITIVVFLLIGTVQAMACDCKEVKSIKEEYDYSKSVVTGEIISKEQVAVTDAKIVEYKPDSKPFNGRLVMKYTMITSEIIKGDFKTDTVEIYTGMGVGDCGFGFIIGKKYLVYGIDGIYNERIFTTDEKALWTINCFRTKLTDNTEIDELRQIARK